MRKQHMIGSLALALLFTSCITDSAPVHPSELEYEALVYDPPQPENHRVELENGMTVFIMEDHMLPTLNISARIRTGSLYEPEAKAGLAAMTGEVMRTGGTRAIPADDLDERLAFLGARLRTSIGTTSGRASLSTLMKDADEGIRLFADLLMNPAFQQDKIELYRNQALHALKTRNDSPRGVLNREFNKLLYGDHPLAREETETSIKGLTREDLLDFHETYFAPNNLILCVAGDFEKSAMLDKIEAAFAGWRQKEIVFPRIPDVKPKNRPGVFMVQKEINQGYINVGHFGIKDTNPDIFAVNVMNFILGGGSFTSRITTKVRSDEGLAYNTGCRFANRHLFPGTFFGYVQTKSSTVPYAISLILDEFRRIRTEEVTDEEMETAKSYYLDSFPDRFATAIETMEAFAALEYDGFPADYYDTYRQKIESVTKADVLRVAKEYIKPEEMSTFIVGDIAACKAGDGKHPCTLEELGTISTIEL